MSNQSSPIARLWEEIQAKTGQRSSICSARAQWLDAAAAMSNLLDSEERPILPEKTLELLRETRFEARHRAAMWTRRIIDIDAEIADLNRQLDELDQVLK